MKHLKVIALAVAVMSASAVNAAAGEVELKTPDISGKLNTLVESKMDSLIKDAYRHRGYVQIVELRPDGSVFLPVTNESINHDVNVNRS